MPYIYLLCAMVTSALLSIMSALFGKKNIGAGDTSMLYSLILCISVMCSWGTIFFTEPAFCVGVIGYSLAYSLCYTMAMIGMFKAYQLGSVSLTAFIKQLSLIGVSLWGFVFWGTPVTVNVLLGLVLIVAALYLCFRPQKAREKKTVSVKWVLFSAMLLVGNAGCSIIQKYQQMAFDGKYGSQLMLVAACFSSVACLMLYLKSNRCRLRNITKGSILCPIVGGVSSAVLNLFILLLLSTSLSESVIFPGIAVGGFMITTLFSVIVQGERLKRSQWIGLGIGAIALVFLNL